jgi:hypothetical protein
MHDWLRRSHLPGDVQPLAAAHRTANVIAESR